jgi:hypothetical protein
MTAARSRTSGGGAGPRQRLIAPQAAQAVTRGAD